MYARVVNGAVEKFPYTINDMKADYPGVSFRKVLTPAILDAFSAVSVAVEDMPNVDPAKYQRVRSETPELVDGVWTLRWTVTPK